MSSKKIIDLGLAAYLKMNGFKVQDIASSSVTFEIEEERLPEFKKLEIAYVNSDESSFDTWLMTLKSMPIAVVDEVNPCVHVVEGLGLSAWLRMKGEYRLVGRPTHKCFAFYVNPGEDEAFKGLQVAWSNCKLRNFDAAMMSIKNVRLSQKPGYRKPSHKR